MQWLQYPLLFQSGNVTRDEISFVMHDMIQFSNVDHPLSTASRVTKPSGSTVSKNTNLSRLMATNWCLWQTDKYSNIIKIFFCSCRLILFVALSSLFKKKLCPFSHTNKSTWWGSWKEVGWVSCLICLKPNFCMFQRHFIPVLDKRLWNRNGGFVPKNQSGTRKQRSKSYFYPTSVFCVRLQCVGVN